MIGEKVLYGKRHIGVIRSTFLFGADGKLHRRNGATCACPAMPQTVLERLTRQ